MNKTLFIICLEDEPEVLEAILRDLDYFEEHFKIEPASSAAEAHDLIASIEPENGAIALIISDHVMPGESGVEFLSGINQSENPVTEATRKILLTGQAGHEDTIKAINEGGIHHYIAKPWEPQQLVEAVRQQLTEYVIRKRLNPLPYFEVLDQAALAEVMRQHGPLADV